MFVHSEVLWSLKFTESVTWKIAIDCFPFKFWTPWNVSLESTVVLIISVSVCNSREWKILPLSESLNQAPYFNTKNQSYGWRKCKNVKSKRGFNSDWVVWFGYDLVPLKFTESVTWKIATDCFPFEFWTSWNVSLESTVSLESSIISVSVCNQWRIENSAIVRVIEPSTIFLANSYPYIFWTIHLLPLWSQKTSLGISVKVLSDFKAWMDYFAHGLRTHDG